MSDNSSSSDQHHCPPLDSLTVGFFLFVAITMLTNIFSDSFIRRSHQRQFEAEMNHSESENTLPFRGLTMETCLDPDADATFGFWLTGVVSTTVGLVGIFGNIATIRVLTQRQMRSSVNFILIALASSDLIFILTAILLLGPTTFYPYNGQLKDYYFVAQPKMTIYLFPLAMIAQTISIYMTFLISCERFIAVCHPLKARGYLTHARTKMCIFLAVVLSVVYNIPKFFEVKILEGSDKDYGSFYRVSASSLRVNEFYKEIYIHWLYCIVMNLIPLSSITFFNLMIYRQVRTVNRLRLKLTTKEIKDIKLTTMLFCVVIVFLTCSFPAVLTNILETFYNIHSDLLTRISNFFVMLNSSVNFIIYVVLVRKFRLIFIRQLKSLFNIRRTEKKFAMQSTTISRISNGSSSDSDDNTTNETVVA